MELIYIWINEYKCFCQQGFNFSPEYKCVMKPDDHAVWNFSITSTGKTNIMRPSTWNGSSHSVISNVTMLVGENGSGKTTLMRRLNSLDCFPDRETEKDGYDEYIEAKNSTNRLLYIFREDGKLSLYTNIPTERIRLSDDTRKLIPNKFFFTDDRDKASSEITFSNGMYGISSIYMTNVPYAYNSGVGSTTSHSGIRELNFAPECLGALAGTFFSFISPDPDSAFKPDKDDKFGIYSNALRRKKTQGELQQVIDILYYDKLMKDADSMANYSATVKTELVIDFTDIGNAEKRIEGIDEYGEADALEVLEEIRPTLGKYYNLDESREHIEYNLKFDFIAEYLLAYGEIEFTTEPKDLYEFYDIAVDNVRNTDNEFKDYFLNAIDEIGRVQELFGKIKPVHNLLPKTDMAYERGFLLSSNENEKMYKDFLSFVSGLVRENSQVLSGKRKLGSFVLRYLSVRNLYLSSGERAFQNVMSWLSFVADLRENSSTGQLVPKKSLLVCIDEVDNMCHPAWQRDIVSNLIDEIEKEYKGYSVQLILSTHSPLCLSNIPRENIIYLANHDGTTGIDNGTHQQSFGRNIYEILDDSFYLEGRSIGKYAEEYIKNLIDRIKSCSAWTSDVEYQKLEDRIDYVGDDLIRAKLYQMLLANASGEDKERRIELLKNYRDRLDKEIEKLGRTSSTE